MTQPISTPPEYATWLRALAQEPQEPVIGYQTEGFVIIVNGVALVTSPVYERLAKALED